MNELKKDDTSSNKDRKKRKLKEISAATETAKPIDESIEQSEEPTQEIRKKRKKNKRKLKSPDDAEISSTAATTGNTESINHSSTITETESSKSKKKKKKKKSKAQPTATKNSPETTPASSIEANEKDNYPYEVVPDDHCETPLEAYEDIAPLLNLLASSFNKTPETLSVFDPYFCEGKMKQRLGSLGFGNVYNEKEDFYASIANQTLPDYDVLLTNPPYSLDHMNRLLNYCIHESRQPFCLLLPNYVYRKDYYVNQYERFPMMFITPGNGRRYLYTTPKGRRQLKSSKITSPFPTFWYCGRISPSIINQLKAKKSEWKNPIVISQRLQDIPLEVAPDNDPRKKKLRNNLKRKKNKQRQKDNRQLTN